MKEFSWRTFHRTFAKENSESDSSYDIFFNAEMLVGDPDSLQSEKITLLFERMEIIHDPTDYQIQLSEEIASHVNSINENTKIRFESFGANPNSEHCKENGQTILEFEFGGQQIHRIQQVSLNLCDKRCVFLSKASDRSSYENLSVKDIIKYTWIRNRNIDLVEFMLTPDCDIVGRAVHPAIDMQWDEFIYCAYTLA